MLAAPTAPSPAWLTEGLSFIRGDDAEGLHAFLMPADFSPADLGYLATAALDKPLLHEPCLRVLLGHGWLLADTACTEPPLARMVRAGRTRLLEALWPGASPAQRADAFEAAQKSGNPVMLKACLALGFPADSADGVAVRPLARAMNANREDFVTLLRAHGARALSAAEVRAHVGFWTDAATLRGSVETPFDPNFTQGFDQAKNLVDYLRSLDRPDLADVVWGLSAVSESEPPSNLSPPPVELFPPEPRTPGVWQRLKRWARRPIPRTESDTERAESELAALIEAEDAAGLKRALSTRLPFRQQSNLLRASALRRAVRGDHADAVAALLATGADPLDGNEGTSFFSLTDPLLIEALRRNHPDTLPLLLSHTPVKVQHATLTHAFDIGRTDWVKRLLMLGVPLTQDTAAPASLLEEPGRYLERAIQMNRTDLIEVLLAAGAPLNEKAASALLNAARATVETVFRHAAQLTPDTLDRALTEAVYRGRPDLIDAALAVGANPASVSSGTEFSRPEMHEWVASYARRQAEGLALTLEQEMVECVRVAPAMRARL